ncbi:hypothetical protein scyTo_0026414, partial [Scyliorhinus torazame]|nr:hypothetical protein [Scyliorhinus torazame]
MDNVLMDDRRIHVDFSQSVAKVQWKGKGAKYSKEDFKEYEKDAGKHANITLKDKVQPKRDSKYELLLDEAVTNGSHSKKRHKEKRHRRHSEEEGDGLKAAKCKGTADQEIQQHRNTAHIEEHCKVKERGHKSGTDIGAESGVNPKRKITTSEARARRNPNIEKGQRKEGAEVPKVPKREW